MSNSSTRQPPLYSLPVYPGRGDPVTPIKQTGRRRVSDSYTQLSRTAPPQPRTLRAVSEIPPQFFATPSRNSVDNTLGAHSPADASEMIDLSGVESMNVPYEPFVTKEQVDEQLIELFSAPTGQDVAIDMTRADVPGLEKIHLHPHQVQSRLWMEGRESGNKKGGLLADEMGLGKTCQLITRMLDSKRSTDKTHLDTRKKFGRTTLIVGPPSILLQWQSEINTTAPELRVCHHMGTGRTKDPEYLKHFDVILTSYPTLQAEHGNYAFSAAVGASPGSPSPGRRGATVKHMALFQNSYLRIVLDEAHTIKNRKTLTAGACFALQGRYRWCLTGTPLQNGPDDVFSLIHFLQIGPFNDLDEFRTQIQQPLAKRAKTTKAIARLHCVMSAFMLRRVKNQLIDGKPILDLPEKSFEEVDCAFDEYEMSFYQALVARTDAELVKIVKSIGGGRLGAYGTAITLLLRLRQACCHPSLCMKRTLDDIEDAVPVPLTSTGEEVTTEDRSTLERWVEQMNLDERCTICQTILASSKAKNDFCPSCELTVIHKKRYDIDELKQEDRLVSSAKIRTLLEILRKIRHKSRGTEKVLVFSQFVCFLQLIEPFLMRENYNYIRYDGSMSLSDRDYAVQRFQSDSNVTVALISLKAGSSGLNLTAANHVILLDPWWNPAVENQAFDRVHRMGQTKPVHIYKLIVRLTVEERILELQKQKQDLADAVLSGNSLGSAKFKLTMDELLKLFRHPV